MTRTLIRTVDGRETPAAGRWTIAPRYPVHYRAGHWWRRTSGTLRTRSGYVLFPEASGPSFQVAFDAAELLGGGGAVLCYQSLSVTPAAAVGQWSVDGEIFTADAVLPARCILHYHGVFRTGETAVARFGWRLRLQQFRSRAGAPSVPLDISADVNAEAPPALLTRKANG